MVVVRPRGDEVLHYTTSFELLQEAIRLRQSGDYLELYAFYGHRIVVESQRVTRLSVVDVDGKTTFVEVPG